MDGRIEGIDGAEAAGPAPVPPSPCVRRCTLDDDDQCVGCGRTLREILDWSAAPVAQKLEIRAAASSRLSERKIRQRIAAEEFANRS